MTNSTDNQRMLSSAVFRARDEYCARLTKRILSYVNPDTPLRVLDIGCGTGRQILDLAHVLPNAYFTGIDLSPMNIELARQAAGRSLDPARTRFIACDYMQMKEGPFDLIMSYSTIHLIPVPTEHLITKLAGDLAPEGLLVNVMPYACAYNSMLINIRKIFRMLRGDWTDHLLLRVGKAVTGKAAMNEEMLRARVPYMYVLPHRLDGREFHQIAQSCGLRRISCEPEVHASIAQLKHNVVCFTNKQSLE